jgi:hypothetical protein
MLKNIPIWIYEPLPYLYALMGVIAILTLDALVGKISGLMLISAGVVVWHQRIRYRRFRRRPPKRDLSWGTNQRMHPPKDLENVKLPKPEPEPRKPVDEEDF